MNSPGTAKLGPVHLMPGVTASNAFVFLIVDLIVMGMVVFVNVGQVYLMNTKLGIPETEQGTLTGNLAFWSEVVIIVMVWVFGLLADKAGRRVVMSGGLLILGTAYLFYPMSETGDGLLLARIIYAVGISAATCMLTVVVHDYPQEQSRGKLVVASGIFGAVGVVSVSAIAGNLPEIFINNGATEIEAGYYLHWFAVAICLVTAVFGFLGMHAGLPAGTEEHHAARDITIGIRMAKKPRIALLYFSAFAARGDLVIAGTFIVLWGSIAGQAAGMPAAEALSKATVLFVISSTTVLLWAPVMGFVLDRYDRLAVLAGSAALATIGFGVVGMIDDPMAEGMWPAFVMLGIGQASCFYASQALIGQEAPAVNRGAVIGTSSACGAVGVMVAAAAGGRLFDGVGPGAPFIMVAGVTAILTAGTLAIRVAESAES